MSDVSPRRTGLPFVVWISPRGNARHDVRVKVSAGPKEKPGEFASVTVRPMVEVVEGEVSGSDLRLLERCVDLNRDALVKFWDGDIEYTEDVLPLLKRLGEVKE